jgi:invasion protein IalB
MFCMLSRLFGIIVLAGQFAAPAASGESKPPDLIYSPWTKLCIDGSCFIVMDVRSECGPVAGAVLIEKVGETKKTLRVNLPVRVSLERGVRIIFDQGPPIARPYIGCYPYGCTADYEAGIELVDQLKQGQILVLEGVDMANLPISASLPLVGFANAYDRPESKPLVLEALTLSQAEREKTNRAEEARKMRCDAATPLR